MSTTFRTRQKFLSLGLILDLHTNPPYLPFMKELPIYFSADKTIYKGYLSPVFGAAGNTWHLMIDNYYCGRLRQYNGKWVFDATPKTASFSKRAEYFGNFVSW